MQDLTLKDIATKLAASLKAALCPQYPQLFPQLMHLLAKGKPVSPQQVADTLHITPDEATAALQKLPNIEFNQEGNLIGSGLTLSETPHQFQIYGHDMFTWCAFDTLFFPIIIGDAAHVKSTCAVTGDEVKLTVTPNKIENLNPNTAVISIVLPDVTDACCNIRGSFCNHVHYFINYEVASSWLVAHQDAIILTVDDAYQVGRMLTDMILTKHEQIDTAK